MKIASAAAALAAMALGMAAASTASAGGGYRHGGRVSIGVVVGAPAYWYGPRPYRPYFYPAPFYAAPAYYYPPYYSYYPPVATASPPVYIERNDARAAPETPQDYWYYCPESNAYYPYVKQCARGWQRVTPQPQG